MSSMVSRLGLGWVCVVLAACGDGAGESGDVAGDGSQTCDLAALIPGLDNVVSAPRAAAMAEILALECGDGIAAPRDLFTSLGHDLGIIGVADARMRLEGGQSDAYPYSSELMAPIVLFSRDDSTGTASLFEPGACAHQVTEALFATAARNPDSPTKASLGFASRVHPTVAIAVYAALGIDFEPRFGFAIDGSRVQYRDTADGREWLFELRGGDCPSGCTTGRSFWWRVVGDDAELLGEWGGALGSFGGEFQQAPEQFASAGFACRKCGDGHATRVLIESACDNGDDDDCDGMIDCADDDCGESAKCRPEICDNAIDDDLDGLTDCADEGCVDALVCGASTACEAEADAAFVGHLGGSDVLVGLDRPVQSCAQEATPSQCVDDFFELNGVSAQCRTCLSGVAECLLACPAIGTTDEAHGACIHERCASPLAMCLADAK